MESAYDVMNVSYSNYTKTFCGLLDYIFFTKQHLELVQVIVLLYAKYLCLIIVIVYYFQVLPMPSHEDVTQHVGLPSVLFPSDHLPLIADLKVKWIVYLSCIIKFLYIYIIFVIKWCVKYNKHLCYIYIIQSYLLFKFERSFFNLFYTVLIYESWIYYVLRFTYYMS